MDHNAPARSRLIEMDALRGVALFGILLVNIFVFHAPYSYYGEFYGAFEGIQADAINAMIDFAAGKFLFIFAFLFGYGIALQYQARSALFIALHTRRMAILLLFGLLHILLFWFGDILATYALLGLLLIPFLRLPQKGILGLAALFLLVRPIYYLGVAGLGWPMIHMEKPAELDELITTMQQGSFLDILPLRIKELIVFMPENLVWYLPKTFGLFLLGFFCAGRDFIGHIRQHPRKYLRVFLVLLLFSLAWTFSRQPLFSQFDFKDLPFMRPAFIAINVLSETSLGMAYIIGFILLFQRVNGIARPFAQAGRMALSNYILQSLLCVLIFYSYGLGLYGQLRPTDLILVTLPIFTVNLVFSWVYLKRYKQGPLEYLWRRLI